MRDRERREAAAFWPNFNHQPVWIYELRGNHLDRGFQIEHNARLSRADLRYSDLPHETVTDVNCFDAAVSSSRRAQASQVEI